MDVHPTKNGINRYWSIPNSEKHQNRHRTQISSDEFAAADFALESPRENSKLLPFRCRVQNLPRCWEFSGSICLWWFAALHGFVWKSKGNLPKIDCLTSFSQLKLLFEGIHHVESQIAGHGLAYHSRSFSSSAMPLALAVAHAWR